MYCPRCGQSLPESGTCPACGEAPPPLGTPSIPAHDTGAPQRAVGCGIIGIVLGLVLGLGIAVLWLVQLVNNLGEGFANPQGPASTKSEIILPEDPSK